MVLHSCGQLCRHSWVCATCKPWNCSFLLLSFTGFLFLWLCLIPRVLGLDIVTRTPQAAAAAHLQWWCIMMSCPSCTACHHALATLVSCYLSADRAVALCGSLCSGLCSAWLRACGDYQILSWGFDEVRHCDLSNRYMSGVGTALEIRRDA